MKNRVFVFFVMLIMFSCKEEKIEFVQSKVKPSTFLLKNLPRDDKFIKEEKVFCQRIYHIKIP